MTTSDFFSIELLNNPINNPINNSVAKIITQDDQFEVDLRDAIMIAAGAGNLDIVKELSNRGNIYYDEAIAAAAGGGHIDTFNWLIEEAKDRNINFDPALAAAAIGGEIGDATRIEGQPMMPQGDIIYTEIMEMIKDKVTLDGWKWALLNAASNGFRNGIIFIQDNFPGGLNLSNYADAINFVNEGKAQEENLERQNDFNQILELLERYRLEKMMILSAQEGDADVVYMLLEQGVNNYDEAIEAADAAEYSEIADLIENYRATLLFEEAKTHWDAGMRELNEDFTDENHDHDNEDFADEDFTVEYGEISNPDDED